ncbi:MAG: Gfo/Idh/MocA family oxidoreductase [Patescibacteria group bacterium]|nr:Gfo/Idh/MocA family oxidoreductase [Patescibacteria group bacterium]
MTKEIKIAIIGYGKRGKTHLRNYSKINGAKVVAICDVDNNIILDRNIKYYQDFKKMIDSEKIDAISICTPTNEHYPIALYCLRKGIHVLCEKPITLTIKQAQELSYVAQKNKLTLQVGYHLKFDGLISKFKSIINSNELGKILMIRARQAHDWGGLKPFGWLLNKSKSGGGTIIDNASHYLNLFEYLLGNIEEIHAFSNNLSFKKDVEDNAIITMKFKTGILGEIETSWQDSSGRNNQLLVYGSKATAEYKETNIERTLEIKKYTQDKDEWNRSIRENIYLPKGIEQLSKKNNIDNSKGLLFESTENMLHYFIDSIGKQKAIIPNNFTRTQQLINSVYESIAKKRVIKIKQI